jgi:hypothetical protein
LVIRAASPRFICRTDSSKSCWNFFISEGIFDSLFQFREERGWQVVELAFRVRDEQPNRRIQYIEVDDSRAAALTPARCSPSYLAAAAATLDEITGFRVGCYPVDEFVALGLGPYVSGVTLKNWGFGYRSHAAIIRQCRISRKR